MAAGSPQGCRAEPHSPAGRAGATLLAPPVPALVLGSPEAAVFLWRQTAWEGQQDKRLCGNEWVTSQVCGKQRGESLCSRALVGEVCNKSFLHVTEGLRAGLASAFIPPPLPKAGGGKGRWVLPGWVVPAAQHGQGPSPPSPSSGTEAGGAVGWAPRSTGGARRGQRWRGPAEKRRKRELSAGECRSRPACRGAAGKGASSLYVQGFLPSPPHLPACPHRSLCRGDVGVVQARGSPLVRGPHRAVLPLSHGARGRPAQQGWRGSSSFGQAPPAPSLQQLRPALEHKGCISDQPSPAR